MNTSPPRTLATETLVAVAGFAGFLLASYLCVEHAPALAASLRTAAAGSFTISGVGSVSRGAITGALAQALSGRAITFARGSTSPSPAGRTTLGDTTPVLCASASRRFEVTGPPDAEGDSAKDAALRLRRAEAAVGYLVVRGGPAGRLIARGITGASR